MYTHPSTLQKLPDQKLLDQQSNPDHIAQKGWSHAEVPGLGHREIGQKLQLS
jgi:hypothetical protein